MASQEYSIKHLEKANVYSSKTPSKNCRGRNTSKLILRDHHHPDTKTRQRQHKKRKKISRRKEIIKIEAEINQKEMKETIVKINKTKTWFFEKINKIDKHLSRLIKKKRDKNQINRIRNEKGEITMGNAKIQRIIRDYYEQLYGNEIDNLEELDRFLEKFNLPRLNQGEIEIMNNRNKH